MQNIKIDLDYWEAKALLRAAQRRHTDLSKKVVRKPYHPPDGKIDVNKAVIVSLESAITRLDDALRNNSKGTMP